jgi:hypothetical protein
MIAFRAAFLLLLGCLLVQPTASAQELGPAEPAPVSARIVNGVLTDAHPTAGVLLAPADPAAAGLVCSGTLIGCQNFLTAAHCVCEGDGPECPTAELDPSGYLVFLQHAGFFSVERVTVHPDYDFPDSDIAVLRLAEPVTGITPTPLPHVTPSTGTVGTLVGFGRAGGSADDFGLKRRTEIETAACPSDLSAPFQLCWDFLDPIGPPGEDGNTCNGDSGGPLFADLGLGKVVVGVTSGGTTPDCLPPDESWDTNVHYFADYVRAQAGVDLENESCGGLSQVGEGATTVSGFSGALSPGSEQAVHVFQVPAGAAEVRVTLNASEEPGADFDLFVRSPETAAKAGFDCSAAGPNQWGACIFTEPAEGEWQLVVQRATGAGEYQATATTFAPAEMPPPAGEVQSSKQRRCLKVQGKLARKVGAAQLKNTRQCVDNAARARYAKLGRDSQELTAQACLTNDMKHRVATASDKVMGKDEKLCADEPPDFGYAGATALAAAPPQALGAMVWDLFGPDLDAALVPKAADRAGAACQLEVLRRAGAVYEAGVRTVLAGAESALAAGAKTGEELAAALESALLGDIQRKITKAGGTLVDETNERCAGSAPGTLFPGFCGSVQSPAELADCAGHRALCRQCQAEEAARAIELDCDSLDDGTANLSCS